MLNCRIHIFIKGSPVLQGKIYKLDKKWIFLCNIDKNKLWYNYNGYSIATQILEAFQRHKIRPVILYKNTESHNILMSKPTDFYKYGITVSWGGHRQIVLPVSKWRFFDGELKEPFNLPRLTPDQWANQGKEPKDIRVNTEVMLRLREDFRKRYPKNV